MEKELLEAIKLLRGNGYVVTKLKGDMLEDMKESEEMSNKGEWKECFGCSCSVCLVN